MIDNLSSLDVGNIVKNSRVLFTKSTWLKVGALISSCNRDSVCDKDGLMALKRTNWNLVTNTRQPSGVAAPVPISIVMITIDMSKRSKLVDEWSDKFIDTCVQEGSIYGSIKFDTHVVIQLFFTNIGADYDVPLGGLSAVGCVVVSGSGVCYSYNLPTGDCEKIAFRCVTHLMNSSINSKPSIMLRMTDHFKRSTYEDCLYMMFITASCASGTSTGAIVKYASKRSTTCLVKCIPGKEDARPTRIISNMRFLMFISSPLAKDVVSDLLLDEINVLDMFRRVVMDIQV